MSHFLCRYWFTGRQHDLTIKTGDFKELKVGMFTPQKLKVPKKREPQKQLNMMGSKGRSRGFYFYPKVISLEKR